MDTDNKTQNAETNLKLAWYKRTIAKVIVISSAILVLIKGIFNYDALASLPSPKLTQLIHLYIGLSALYLTLQSDFWIPFNGPTVIPVGAFTGSSPIDQQTDITTSTIHLDPNAIKVMIWTDKYGTNAQIFNVINGQRDMQYPKPVKAGPIYYRFIYSNGIVGKLHFHQ